MLFLSRHCSSLPGERFVFSRFHASSDDDNRSPFQLSLAHAIFPNMFPSSNDNENDNETISILDKMSFADVWLRCEKILEMILCR